MPIFVFGSNRKGIHGAGAAKYARQHEGAINGYGEGRAGNSYALPTKHSPYTPMEMATIQTHVAKFLDYATLHPELEFTVTQVGCGLGGWLPVQIAPMFYYHPANCKFDAAWLKYLPKGTLSWGQCVRRPL